MGTVDSTLIIAPPSPKNSKLYDVDGYVKANLKINSYKESTNTITFKYIDTKMNSTYIGLNDSRLVYNAKQPEEFILTKMNNGGIVLQTKSGNFLVEGFSFKGGKLIQVADSKNIEDATIFYVDGYDEPPK